MRILILNWRDTRNPSSGGAEVLTHEVAKRWVIDGHSVTQFSSYFPNAKNEEVVDGVRIIRRGSSDARLFFGSVHFFAFIYYFKYFKNKFDVIIDEIHGLPFFTPFYVKEKKVALICEVADELWEKAYGKFFGSIGRLMEIIYLQIIYKNIIFTTISKSSAEELIKNGVKKSNIRVLPMGISIPASIIKRAKENIPTLLYVGRLSRAKGIEDALRTIYLLKEKGQKIQLKVIGRGNEKYAKFIHNFCKDLGISRYVEFLGFVSEKEKFEVISSSSILISPSVKEGFGLTIPEAGHMSVPSVVYNSLGLSEIIINNKNGLICKENTPESLAETVALLLQDKILYKKLSDGARKESAKYNWDNTARAALEVISG